MKPKPMNALRTTALVLALSLSAAACGGASSGGGAHSVARVNAAAMPEGEAWIGVYYHPIYGYLHIMEQGDSIVGRWKRTDQSAWGELSGHRAGNLLRYEWKEHKVGQVGPAATSKGKGVFQYKNAGAILNASGQPIATEADFGLAGQFGLGEDEMGSDWNCVKQQRMLPDFKAVSGDSSAIAAPTADGAWK